MDEIIFEKIKERLVHAREKHNVQEWLDGGENGAYRALSSEFSECLIARSEEPRDERMKDELLDLIAVAVRIWNDEYRNI